MSLEKKDHLFAIITPAIIFLIGSLGLWCACFLMPLLYFVYRKLAFQQAKDCTLTLFDLTVSLILLGAVLVAIVFSLQLVARDGGFTIPGISLVAVLSTILGLSYYLVCSVLITIKTYQRKPYTPKLSMGIFAALRGRRSVSGKEEVL